LAAGIEDAIGPYLESAVSLLTSINENGTSNTTEMMQILAQLAKDGERTPELLAKAFGSVNSAVKGATGEASAFLQTAFARAGIGGGTVGGTKFAMSSGGIMGMNRDELEKRGYNKDMLNNMDKQGMFSGLGNRTEAIMKQFKESGGLKAGQKISDVKDTNRMVGLGNLANSVFGTKGNEGFDTLLMLEKVQNKQMSQKQFDQRMKQMQESKDPSLSRLDKINSTLSGQTEILNNINTNLMEQLGKQGVVASNALTKGENQMIEGTTNLATAVNDTGVVEGSGNLMEKAGKFINKGGLGDMVYDAFEGGDDKRMVDRMTSDSAITKQRKKLIKRDHPEYTDEQIDQHIKDKDAETLKRQQSQSFPTAKDIGKEVANALRQTPISNTVNNKIQMPDGKITERTNR
jgi:hypothetical protein